MGVLYGKDRWHWFGGSVNGKGRDNTGVIVVLDVKDRGAIG